MKESNNFRTLETLQSVEDELSESQYKLADRTVAFNIYVFVLYNLLPHIAKPSSEAFGFIELYHDN